MLSRSSAVVLAEADRVVEAEGDTAAGAHTLGVGAGIGIDQGAEAVELSCSEEDLGVWLD